MQYQPNQYNNFNTPIKNFDEKIQRQIYTPLESTAEPGRYPNDMISRQHSRMEQRDRSPTPISNFERISNAKPRNISNFDMPIHRAGKRNINCRSSTDNNIFNLQSLVNIRARGSGQPNQQINQRNQNKGSMARSASFVNLDEIRVRSPLKQILIQKSQRFPQKIPHFTSTVFNHQLQQQTKNTGRFLTTYQLTARSLSPFARKDSKFQNSLREKDHQAHIQRKKGFVTKSGNQNMKNWTTLNLTQQDNIAMMYQKMKSERLRHEQIKRSRSQLIHDDNNNNSKQYEIDRYSTHTDKLIHTFKPQNLQQAKAYNKFLSKSTAISPNTSVDHSPSHREQNNLLSTLPSPQTYQDEQNNDFEQYVSSKRPRKIMKQSSPISNFNIRENLSPTRTAKSVIIDRTNDKQSMGGSEYSYQKEQYGGYQNSPGYKNARSDYVGGNQFNNINQHTGRLLNDFADDDVKSQINVYRENYNKPQWKIKKEMKEKEKEINATVNNSVNFNPTSKKIQEEKFYQSLLKEEEKLRQKLQKIQQSNQQMSRTQVLNHHTQVPEELDLQDNNFVDRMSGDPQRLRHNYLENMRQNLSKRVGQNIMSGQSVNYQKKQKLHGAPSFLSAQQRAMVQKLGPNYVAQGTSIDIGQITPQMIHQMKQNHHSKLKAQIEMERQQKLQQRIRKYQDQAIESKQIQKKNMAHSQQLKYITDMKKLQLKHYIEKQKREKEVQNSMAYGEKSRLLLASREKTRQMEETDRVQRQARKAITLKIADIQRAQMALKSENHKVKKAVAKIAKSPGRMSPLSYSPERSVYK